MAHACVTSEKILAIAREHAGLCMCLLTLFWYDQRDFSHERSFLATDASREYALPSQKEKSRACMRSLLVSGAFVLWTLVSMSREATFAFSASLLQ